MFLIVLSVRRFTVLRGHENGVGARADSARSKYDFNKDNG
jgi:hypothetical protein